MRILVADDNVASQILVKGVLSRMGHEVILVNDGAAAWQALERQMPSSPRVAILDWMMPKMAGPDVCRRVRAAKLPIEPYLLLVTGRDTKDDLVTGLKSGADDYLTKPFENAELTARVSVGVRLVELQEEIAQLKVKLTALESSPAP